MDYYPKLSIVIVTKDRELELNECIRSLSQYIRFNDEVIVIDGSRKPLRINLLDSRVAYFHLPSSNMDEARNFGIKVSKNEIIAFLDSDGYIEKSWLLSLLQAYRKHPEAGGIGGSVVQESLGAFGPRGGRITPWGMVYGNFKDGENIIESQHLIGCNMSFRKDVLLKVQGFDTAYNGTALREDTDIAVRIRCLGYKLFYQPKAIFYHLESKQGRLTRNKQARSFIANHTYFYIKNYLSVNPVLVLFLPFFFIDIFILLLAIKKYYTAPLAFFNGLLGFFDGLIHYKKIYNKSWSSTKI